MEAAPGGPQPPRSPEGMRVLLMLPAPGLTIVCGCRRRKREATVKLNEFSCRPSAATPGARSRLPKGRDADVRFRSAIAELNQLANLQATAGVFPVDYPANKRPLNARKIAVSARFPDPLRTDLQILFLTAVRTRCPSVGGLFHCKTST